ncbi:hypothetical protein HPB50_026365 [Hyalomma asiaticum]|uniref:Uncharacterized protein n=1 Tax=Hyalomma asiaticum TaxID=266040 RepID=A0ACB7T9Y4_HYAAI|nr:hypothetical protein HPB50_026365 [Hyalomma asiaticum]
MLVKGKPTFMILVGILAVLTLGVVAVAVTWYLLKEMPVKRKQPLICTYNIAKFTALTVFPSDGLCEAIYLDSECREVTCAPNTQWTPAGIVADFLVLAKAARTGGNKTRLGLAFDAQEIREKLTVNPLPRNVQPVHNAGRRKARASATLKQIHNDNVEASFVDAATYRDGKAFAVFVVDTIGKLINSASVRTTDLEVAEQVAVALAMQDGRRDRVYSDSKAAVRAFRKAGSPARSSNPERR